MKRRIPEHVSTGIRKIEPVGGGLVRLYFALAGSGAWDDQVTILMPMSVIGDCLSFVGTSVREMSAEMDSTSEGTAAVH